MTQQISLPKIVPDTFIASESVEGKKYRDIVKGVARVELDGVFHTVDAERMVGLEIISAFGFKAKGKIGKTYPLHVTYRTNDDEHDCRVGGGVVQIAKVWKQ
jgi:hypothetical protein